MSKYKPSLEAIAETEEYKVKSPDKNEITETSLPENAMFQEIATCPHFRVLRGLSEFSGDMKVIPLIKIDRIY
jgi:hypothetical protein